MTTIVIALGGNALLRRGDPMDPAVQDRNVAAAAAALLGAVKPGDRLVLTHGNGPQVGLLAVADADRPGDLPFPLDVIDAESEGMIGYLLARHLNRPGGRPAAALLTQVLVDPADKAFAAPSKPIGPVVDEAAAQILISRRGWHVVQEAGSAPGPGAEAPGWRRVVASPSPLGIVELESIRCL